MKAIFLIAIAGLVFLGVAGGTNIAYQLSLLERSPTPKPSVGILANPVPATPQPPAWPLAFRGPSWITGECAQAKSILKEDRDLHQYWVTALERDGVTALDRLSPGAADTLIFSNTAPPRIIRSIDYKRVVQDALLEQRQWRDTFQIILNDFGAACNYFKAGPRAPVPWILAQCQRAQDRLGFALKSHQDTLEAFPRLGFDGTRTWPEWDRQWIANYQFLLGMVERICN